MKTAQELVAAAKARIKEVSVDEARALLADGVTFLDVREPVECSKGTIGDAVTIPRGLLEFKLAETEALADRAAPVVVYCASGGRSALATATLMEMGYSGVMSLAGGYGAWSAAE